jgi:hypothetical protein
VLVICINRILKRSRDLHLLETMFLRKERTFTQFCFPRIHVEASSDSLDVEGYPDNYSSFVSGE